MDMQNVSNLQIPEGRVKTIHDGNGRLLWGAVGYDTKYAGNTTQAAYTGKNLAPSESVFVKNNPYSDMVFSKSVFIPAGTYSASISNVADATNWRFAFKFFYTDGTNVLDAITQGVVTFSINSMGDTYSNDTACVQRNNSTLTSLYFTTTIDTYVVFGIMGGDVSNSTTLNYQLEAGETASTYEPYTGGIPSPNPDYPQPVNVVTGAQTVTVSDGINSEAFSASLGSLELCKIGTYQDYIYKSGEDWYVHKAINKVILNGSEAWSMYSGRDGTFYITKNDIMLAPSISATPDVISDYYEPEPFISLYNMIVDYGVANHNAQRWIAIRNKDYSDVSSFKTWLASNNTTVYYVLATPANTKITDNTLIDQLNAVHQWATRYGYNTTVSGDLPIVLRRDSLQ